jgi:hypothetical protein
MVDDAVTAADGTALHLTHRQQRVRRKGQTFPAAADQVLHERRNALDLDVEAPFE